MQEIRIEKITLNIGVGEAGDKLDKAVSLLKEISRAKPVKTKTMKRVPTWNIRPKLVIGTKVTLRGKKAEDVLRRLLKSVNNKIHIKKFDEYGNFSFGIKEYIEIPGIEYKRDIGIRGLNVTVDFIRSGVRVKRKKIKRGKLPKRQHVSDNEIIKFMEDNFKTVFS